MNPADPLRVLLWSVKGSGLHYGGPGSSAYRLYSKIGEVRPGAVRVTLAHGFPDQPTLPLFDAQHLVRDAAGTVGRQRFLAQAAFVRRGRRWVADRAGDFDVFHGVQGFHHTILPAWEAEKRGTPACIKLAAHRTDLSDKPALRHRLLKLAAKRREVAKRLSAMICISRSIEEECLGYGWDPRRLAYIPDGADVDHFTPPDDKAAVRARLGVPDRFTLVLCGGMVRRKRPHLLAEAVALLKSRGVEAQALLVGPEHEAEYVAGIKEKARADGVSDRVIWAGFHDDVSDFYRCGDAFCLPSSSEGLPNAMLEAMAGGLPVIGTRISGAIDLIDEGNCGRFVEPTPESVADAAAAYATDPARLARESARARDRIVADFSTTAAVEKHLALFRRVVAGEPANSDL